MLIKKLIIAAVILVTAAFSCVTALAAELSTYEVEWTYSVTNNSDADIYDMPFGFGIGELATESPYQTGIKLVRDFGGLQPYEISDGREKFRTNLAVGETRSVTFKWTINSGDFDQNLTETPTYAKVLEAYKFVTSHIKYGVEQDYALPRKANCQTFAAALGGMLTDSGVKWRRVVGYTQRIVNKKGELAFGKADISDRPAHCWIEWYEPERGEWIFCDPTFDAGKSKFVFFGRCPAKYPHLAMYYENFPTRTVSWTHREKGVVEWKLTVGLSRSAYVDDNAAVENLLERFQRHENEAALTAKYAAERELDITLSRNSDGLALLDGREIKVPPNWRVMVNNDTGELIFSGGDCAIRVSLTGDGKYTMFVN